MEPFLTQQVAQRPVVVLTGARQTGKTSLVKRCFPDYELVSLDLPSEAEQAEQDPRGFLARHPPPLIVDEVQYAPGLFRHLKQVVDARRDCCGQFILTGSQQFTMMQAVSESLAGRAAILQLEGLSWHEISAARLPITIEKAMIRGGLPELYEKPDLNAEVFFRSYVATYLERDLRQSLKVTNLRDFERFVRICALRTAQLLNKADLSRDVGVSASTAGQWLSVLQASNQVALLEPWFSNSTKTLVKMPKIYLCDTGLAAFLVGLPDATSLLASPLRGHLWETFVFSEIRRRQLARSGGWAVNFWRDRSKEVDFLFHRAGRFSLVDAKWSDRPDRAGIKTMAKVAAMLPAGAVERQALICRTSNEFPITPDASALPLTMVDTLF